MTKACLTIIAAGALFEGLIEDGRGGRWRLKPNDNSFGLQAVIDFSAAAPKTFARGEEVPRSAENISAIGCASNRHGFANDWSGRDAWALLFASMLRAASKQITAPVAAIRFIAPPGLNDGDRQCLIVAGHLAGASHVEICPLSDLLSIESGHDGGVHLVLQFDADALHGVCLDLGRSKETGMEADWSQDYAGAKVAAKLVDTLDPPANVRTAALGWALDAIPAKTAGQAEWLADDRGPPFVAQLPAPMLEGIASEIVALVCDWLKCFDKKVGKPDYLHLHGTWADILAVQMQVAFPDAQMVVSHDLSAPLDFAVAPDVAEPTLKGDITAAATGARSVQTDSVLMLVRSGTQLPHTLVNDSLETGLFLRDFSLFYAAEELKEPAEIGVIEIPAMLEQVSHSRIVVRILADTDDYLIFTTTLGQCLSKQGVIFDKKRDSGESIAPPVLEALGYI